MHLDPGIGGIGLRRRQQAQAVSVVPKHGGTVVAALHHQVRQTRH